LITTDDCSAYANVLMQQYGETVVPPRTGKPGRPRKPYKRWPIGTAYATVNKSYRKGKVAATKRTLVHRTLADLSDALVNSSCSGQINTAFVERQNGTDRTHNARKRRTTYEFSKDLVLHAAVSWWVMLCYNFHHTNRSLRLKLADGSFVHRTPAVAAGLADAPLSIADILTLQLPEFTPVARPRLVDFSMSRAGFAS
jgi:hypothetical protein